MLHNLVRQVCNKHAKWWPSEDSFGPNSVNAVVQKSFFTEFKFQVWDSQSQNWHQDHSEEKKKEDDGNFSGYVLSLRIQVLQG